MRIAAVLTSCFLLWGCGSAAVQSTGSSSASATSAVGSTGSTSSSGATSTTAGSSAGSTSAASSGTTGSSSATSTTTAGSSSATSTATTGSSGAASTGGSTGTTAGDIEVTTPLQLDSSAYVPGAVVSATVAWGNVGGSPDTLQRGVITLRPPGGTHANGPYDDLAPTAATTTLQPGESVSLSATFTLPADAPTGTWEAYSTWQDAQGSYHDGASVFVTVGAPGTTGTTGTTTGTTGSGGTTGGGYSVAGNTIYDANGNPHLFHGVDRTALEWSSTGYNNSLADYQAMRSWNANVVRIALNQDYWLSGAARYDPNYQAFVQQNVSWAEQAGMDVILDLHWSDTGDLSATNDGTSPGQQLMADANSVTFWSQVASAYKNDPRVIFELYNEPHDVPWDTLLNGGVTSEGWYGHGMQELYDTVRATGAQNLVVVGGLDYAYDLSGYVTSPVQGFNIAYATHPYYWNNVARPPSDWDRGFGNLAAIAPVIATEFGTLDCGTAYVDQFLAYADAHNVSWTAWAWWPGGCSYPALINSWSYDVSPMGVPIKNALLSYP